MDTTTIHNLHVGELAAHPDNLRTAITDLSGLTKSIKEGGVVEPLVVIPLDGGGHRVVAGHRRLAARSRPRWTPSRAGCATTSPPPTPR